MIKLEVNVRDVEEIRLLHSQIDDLVRQLKDKQNEVYRMAQYADKYLAAIDMLQEARTALDRAGVDSSFIRID